MNDTTSEAHELGDMGIRVFPCRPNDKRPAISDWPNVASSEAGKIGILFAKSTANLAIRCGATDSGVAIFVVDIDIKDGQPGAESWADFCRQHPEVREQAQLTASVSTPSGGWHFYFAVPEGYDLPTNGKPFPGVDIRGEGGYVLAPPSTLPNGEYAWVRTIADDGIMWAPPALMEAVLTPRSEPPTAPSVLPVAQLVADVSHGTSEDSPKDWAKQNFSVYEWLLRNGWQPGKRRGQQEEITRPGKSQREGTSATMHHDSNIVNIHTTTIPHDFHQIGHLNRSGGVTINGFDAYMIENGHRDAAAAMSELRRSGQMPASPAPAGVSAGLVPQEAHPMQEGALGLNLPDEFWESRDWLRHIRDAAWHRMLNPTAVLGAVLVRYTASIDPRVQLPEIVGSTGTFDMFVMLVGNPGSGKSTAWSCAKDLMPTLPKKIRDDVPLGTGEGLVEMLYARINDDGIVTNKKSDQRALYYDGVCVMVNEGKALGEQSARTGSVIIETLCQAWMGETLGQANASEDTFRHVPSKTRRITACIGIQTENAPIVFEGKFKATGLPQRMVALWAHPDYLPDEDDTPDWPGELSMPKPVVIGGLTVFSADAEIVRTVRSERRAVALREHNLNELDVHLRLAQLKLAGVFAAADGLTHISLEHWALAEAVLASHKAMRSTIYTTHQQRELERRVTQATRQAETQSVVDDHLDQAKLQKCIKRVRDLLDQQGTWTRGKMLNRVTPGQQPHFDDALEALALTGDLRLEDDSITKI